MSVDKKIEQLLEKKKKIDNEIEELKLKNTESLTKALVKVADIEKLDTALILGAVLKAVENISDDEKEVLAKVGKTFLGRYKISSPKKARTNKK
ncbi:hypothetical protein OAP56_02630 [Rickettsiaceae bacterium]|nr:hypothetical protein [Rickettsiaceae bacterium]